MKTEIFHEAQFYAKNGTRIGYNTGYRHGHHGYHVRLGNCKLDYPITIVADSLSRLVLGETVPLYLDLCDWAAENNLVEMQGDGARCTEAQLPRMQLVYEDFLELCRSLLSSPPGKRYAAVIRAEAVRVERTVSRENEAAEIPGATVFLGIFQGDEKSVMQYAANYAKVPVEDIEIFEI